MINTTASEPLRGGPSSVQKKKKKNRKNKKRTVIADGNETDSSDASDELSFFATAARSKKSASNNILPTQQMPTFQEAHIGDPMEVVVRDVLIATKGEFSAGVVRDCVSRMFDNAQKYDNTEAVVKQLKIERGDVMPEERKTVAETQGSHLADSVAPVVPTQAVPSQVAKITSARPTGMSAVAPEPPITKYARPGANDTTGVHALPITNKLEIAAAHQPLSAGLEALCSWAQIIGVDKAPAQFFAPDCRAIELIMLALVNDPNIIFTDAKLKMHLTALLQKLLSSPFAPENLSLVTNLVTDIENVLRKVGAARTASNMQLIKADSSAANALANNIGGLLRRLSASIHQPCDEEGKDEVQKSESELIIEAIAGLEKEIKVLKVKVPKLSSEQSKEQSPAVLKKLVAARDATHEIVSIHSQIVALVSQAKNAKSSGGKVASGLRKPARKISDGIKTSTLEELANDILADVGESATTLSMKKAQAAAAQSDLLTVGNDNTGTVSKLNEIKVCDEKLSEFLIQKSNLENQLAALEREIVLVTTRRDILRNEYVKVSSQAHEKMSRLSATKAEAERTEMLGAAVRGLTSTFSLLDRNVRDIEEELCAIMLSQNNSAEVNGSPDLDRDLSDISSVVAAKRDAFYDYVSSEVACIESLKGRVVDLRNKQLQKNREILEYERIGIQALVEELRKDQEKLGENCAEDIGTIRSLQECLVDVIKGTITPADLALANKEGDASVWAAPRRAVGELTLSLHTGNVPVHPVLEMFGICTVPNIVDLSTTVASPAVNGEVPGSSKTVLSAKSPAKSGTVGGSDTKPGDFKEPKKEESASSDLTRAEATAPKRGARSARNNAKVGTKSVGASSS